MSKKLSKKEIEVLVDVIIERKDKEIKDNYREKYKNEIKEFKIIKKEIIEKYLNLEKEYKEKLEEFKNRCEDDNFRIYMDNLNDVNKCLNWESSNSRGLIYDGYCFNKNRNLKYDDNLKIKINNELVLNNIKNDINIEELINELLKKINIEY
jgi:hypothetical protein